MSDITRKLIEERIHFLSAKECITVSALEVNLLLSTPSLIGLLTKKYPELSKPQDQELRRQQFKSYQENLEIANQSYAKAVVECKRAGFQWKIIEEIEKSSIKQLQDRLSSMALRSEHVHKGIKEETNSPDVEPTVDAQPRQLIHADHGLPDNEKNATFSFKRLIKEEVVEENNESTGSPKKSVAFDCVFSPKRIKKEPTELKPEEIQKEPVDTKPLPHNSTDAESEVVNKGVEQDSDEAKNIESDADSAYASRPVSREDTNVTSPPLPPNAKPIISPYSMPVPSQALDVSTSTVLVDQPMTPKILASDHPDSDKGSFFCDAYGSRRKRRSSLTRSIMKIFKQ